MNENEEKKLTFKEIWANRRYKALIKLGAYLFFIILVVIFSSISINNQNRYSNTIVDNTIKFEKIEENNYLLNIDILINNSNLITNYNYLISKLNEEAKIIKTNNDIETIYYLKENNYYVLNNDNYLLTNKDAIYDILDYTYLDINNIIKYLNLGILYNEENNTKYYQVALKNIILDYEEDKNITIIVTDSEDKTIIKLDYTNLIEEDDILNYQVTLTFSNYGEITNNDLILQ